MPCALLGSIRKIRKGAREQPREHQARSAHGKEGTLRFGKRRQRRKSKASFALLAQPTREEPEKAKAHLRIQVFFPIRKIPWTDETMPQIKWHKGSVKGIRSPRTRCCQRGQIQFPKCKTQGCIPCNREVNDPLPLCCNCCFCSPAPRQRRRSEIRTASPITAPRLHSPSRQRSA